MDIKICQTIKKLRLSNNISQETLANALGISTQAISKWENLRALPDITLLPDIAVFTNEYYSEYKAQYINHTFVMQARKL
ncbi:MAG: helix-turn-helix transcriptional regulator [Ruminococcaceae bacterium]|nr:helix-turn-helix transcriptional regulator [Oscillospiraceae bacterium]